MPEPFLTASEIGEYAFCRQAWYLRRARVRPSPVASERLSHGLRIHHEIGRKTDELRGRRRLNRLLLVLAIGLIVVSVLQLLASVASQP
jgi:hypothetical protein